jgi:[acyl-carrier-protein] S-malonyltransferase
VRLPISIPSHSPAMAPAAAAFALHVDRARFSDARVPVMLNSTARPATSAARLRRELRDHMCNAVLWWPSVQAMIGLGVRLFAEAGPGHSFEKALGQAIAPAKLFTLDRPGALASVAG